MQNLDPARSRGLPTTPPLFPFLSGRFTSQEEADPDSIVVTLFVNKAGGRVCGWYIGPVSIQGGKPSLPYLAPSREMFGQVAILRAGDAAAALGCGVCLVDPADLWPMLWGEW